MGNKPIIYIAGPLFTVQDRKFLELIRDWVYEAGGSCFVPHDNNKHNENKMCSELTPEEECFLIFKKDMNAVDKSDGIVALLDGVPCDSGTCVELGYAYARKKPILGLRSDLRTLGNLKPFKLKDGYKRRNFESEYIELMIQNLCSEFCFEPHGDESRLKKATTSFVKSLV